MSRNANQTGNLRVNTNRWLNVVLTVCDVGPTLSRYAMLIQSGAVMCWRQVLDQHMRPRVVIAERTPGLISCVLRTKFKYFGSIFLKQVISK